MNLVIRHFRELIFAFHGIFVIDKKEVSKEIEDIYNEVYLYDSIHNRSSDKIRMHSDVSRLNQDFKKALTQYKKERLNG